METDQGLNAVVEQDDTAQPTPAASLSYHDFSPHPWRRLFARLLDTTVGGFVAWQIIGFVYGMIDAETAAKFFQSIGSNRAPGSIFTFALATFPNALLIGTTRSSLGKWIFGIQVSRLDGTPLGFRDAFRREASVWIQGLGFGIPVVNWVTLYYAYMRLTRTATTLWDEPHSTRVGQRESTTQQAVLNVIGVLLWLTAFAATIYLQLA